MRSAEIGLHDLAKAFSLLGTDEHRASCIALSLGFSLEKGESDIRSTPFQPDTDSPSLTTIDSPPLPPIDTETKVFVTSPATRSDTPDFDLSMVASEFLALMAAANDGSTGHAGPEEIPSVESYVSVARSQPLFRPEWLPEIVYAIGSTQQRTGSINIQRMIGELAKGESLSGIEFTTKASLSLGLDLLIDFSSSMEPYWGDLRAIQSDMNRIVGAAKIALYPFRIRPWSKPHPSLKWLHLQPTSSSLRPAIVASNFGLWKSPFTRAMELDRHLLQFLRIRRQTRSLTIALIPASQAEFSSEVLSEFDVCFAWDRSTSPRAIWTRRKK